MTDTAVDLVEKLCRRCGEIKPLSQFHRSKGARDGRQIYCKECMRQKALDYRRRKLEENPDAFRRRQVQITDRHRRKTNNERGRAVSRARNAAVARLIAAHERQFDAIYRLVLAERGLLKEDQ